MIATDILWLEQIEFLWTNNQILSSIRKHTTLLSLLEPYLILFPSAN
jgi:hypothetical protein